MRMVQIIGVACARLQPSALFGVARPSARLRMRHGGPDVVGQRLQAAEGVEQTAVGGGIGQRAVVVLAVDFDEFARRSPAKPAR